MGVTIAVDIGAGALVVLESGRLEPTGPKDAPELRHVVRHIEKIAAGAPYASIAERVAQVGEHSQSLGAPMILLDATGLGRPAVALLRERVPFSLRAVTVTGGGDEKQTDAHSLRAPRKDLAAALGLVLQSHRLDVAPDCALQNDLASAPLALALWWAERSQQAESFGAAWRNMAAR